MKKTPYLYNTIQSEEIQEFISNNFGKGGGYIAHELKSEYVHTDTMLIAPENTDRTFVTFGMGARKMNTPNNAKRCELVMCATKNIATQSKESFIISGELARQRRNIELIASENIVSESVLAAAGTILTNKYAEGYPAKRYYGGCYEVDKVEEIARQRACQLFGAEHANVQPHSGASANLPVNISISFPTASPRKPISLITTRWSVLLWNASPR